MNRSKVMFSGLVFSVVFGLMYWYRDLLGNKEITIMDQSLINHFDLKLCLTVAVLSMLLIVVLLYSKEVDPDQYRFEFIRSTLSQDELNRIDGLDKEGKRIAYEMHFNEFSYKQILECRTYVNENKPKTNHRLKLGLISLISMTLVFVLYPTYSAYKVAENEYNEMLRLQEEAYNQIIEDEYITLDGLPTIHVIPGNSLKIGDVQKYMDLFVKSQPDFLLSNCRMIHICEPKNFMDIAIADGVDVRDDGLGTTCAYASEEDFSITLQIDVDDEHDQQNTVSHELSHIFDFASGSGYGDYGISNSAQLQSLYQNYPDCVGAYGATDSAEYFAQAGAMYVNDPENLKSVCMDLYNFVDSLYHMY
ncbi:zinc-dependent peptidase [uncultured Holdemanella sp.]|uniref:zinc-dependent peptidase n=1 Tax=uncultured Holdemanella sp. TaxID=1763549 RepID=UPI0025D91E9D|nr:zinc-dependent peptidase [uncultured Holdemanella sp.]